MIKLSKKRKTKGDKKKMLSNQSRPNNTNAVKIGPKRARGPRIREDLLAEAKKHAAAEGISVGKWIDQAIENRILSELFT